MVDDDVNLQTVYQAIFSTGSIEIVAQAYNGAEAVDTYTKLDEKIDVVLMDQRMPVMDGVTATKKILEADKNARIIFLSADESCKDLALASGAKLVLTKPIRLEELIDAIEKISETR